MKEPDIIICEKCGEEYNWNPHTHSPNEPKRYCFTCNYWLRQYSQSFLTGRSLVFNGAHYIDGGNEPNPRHSDFLGFGGALWEYKYLGKDEVHLTNNLWYQGVVPEQFRDLLVDTVEFLRQPTPTGFIGFKETS